MIEVEWVLPGEGAVEPGLEECGPAVLVLIGTALVRLADPGNAGVDALEEEEEKRIN